MPIITAKSIEKTYTDLIKPLNVLSGASLSVDMGETVGIYGASGSGKSTLLHILGGLDTPNSGSVEVLNTKLEDFDDDELTKFRNKNIGFVFQFYHLLSEFTALENVMLPALIGGIGKKDARMRAISALSSVNLEERMEHRPPMLSGGEQQRVAIARAVVMNPPLLLADEPTGNLDSNMSKTVWTNLLSIAEGGQSLIVVTHNESLIADLSSVYKLQNGVLMKMK